MPSQNTTSAQPLSKQYYTTDSPWEAKIGYYRAVRHETQIFVSGTTAVDPSSGADSPKVLHPGDAGAQTRVALEEIIKAIKALGGRGAENILRTKMFVQRQEDCGPVAQAYREVLGKQNGEGFGSAATMIVVGGFVDPEMLVEIECDAFAET